MQKENLGYLDKSHSQFAEFLLGLCARENAGQHSSPKISPSDSTGSYSCSLPYIIFFKTHILFYINKIY